MNIVIAEPPIIEEIVSVFPEARNFGVVFAWGSTIFNPSGGYVPPEIRAHEGIHYGQQTDEDATIRAWWRKYLVDVDFRYSQELPAHRAEYRYWVQTHKDRNGRSRFLHHVAGKLASSLYGNMVSQSVARKAIMK